tara:strand:- start:471 stop:1235 length:765 start_codon:yes stop_codon:yes gene_type:complete
MKYSEKEFYKKILNYKGKRAAYYISPILEKHGFTHAFFTKDSSDIELKYLSKNFQRNYKNCYNKQVHSNFIVFGSETNTNHPIFADGIISDQENQNLWIYTADCMPILVADFRNKIVASLHCGRMGLEKKIIKKLVTLLKNQGCNLSNLIVAIGPTISSKKYIIEKDLFNQFNRNINCSNIYFDNFKTNNFLQINAEEKIELSLKKYAYCQLIQENIHSKNIDISNQCTYILNNEFHSYRKTKTEKRQWSFISN